MAVDVVLWFLIAAGIAFISCGCIYTAPANTRVKVRDARNDRGG
jgi:hypothetical protein